MDQLDLTKIFSEELDKIIELLKIRSVYDENSISEKMPYGENVYKAFVYMKERALTVFMSQITSQKYWLSPPERKKDASISLRIWMSLRLRMKISISASLMERFMAGVRVT